MQLPSGEFLKSIPSGQLFSILWLSWIVTYTTSHSLSRYDGLQTKRKSFVSGLSIFKLSHLSGFLQVYFVHGHGDWPRCIFRIEKVIACMVSSAIWIKHARVSFSKTSK
jgi:hypothetical protein